MMRHRHATTCSRLLSLLFAAFAVALLGWSVWLLFASVHGTPVKPKKTLNISPITRIPAGAMGVQEFFERFHDTPVIIEGEVRHHPAFKLGWEGLKQVCGDADISTGVYDAASPNWGGLRDSYEMRLDDYVDKFILKKENATLDVDEQQERELRYASAGTGLPTVCPRLELFTPVSKYFSNSLQTVSDLELYERSNGTKKLFVGQPEIFLGAANTQTEIHMDNIFSPFWMKVYTGSKTFRLISYEDGVKHLNLGDKRKNFMMSQNPQGDRYRKTFFSRSKRRWETRLLEIWNPDFEAFPELERVPVLEGTINAGDVLFLPSSTLHGVHNKEDSFGSSINAFYPGTAERFAKICAESDFALSCEGAASLPGCEVDAEDIQTQEQLRHCLLETPYAKEVERVHRQGKARDMFLHEMAGFQDYMGWCEAICDLEADYEIQKHGERQEEDEDQQARRGSVYNEDDFVDEIKRGPLPVQAQVPNLDQNDPSHNTGEAGTAQEESDKIQALEIKHCKSIEHCKLIKRCRQSCKDDVKMVNSIKEENPVLFV